MPVKEYISDRPLPEDKSLSPWHGVKVVPGLREPGSQDPRTWDPGPTTKFKSWTQEPSRV